MFYIPHDYIVKQIIDNIIIKINASAMMNNWGYNPKGFLIGTFFRLQRLQNIFNPLTLTGQAGHDFCTWTNSSPPTLQGFL